MNVEFPLRSLAGQKSDGFYRPDFNLICSDLLVQWKDFRNHHHHVASGDTLFIT